LGISYQVVLLLIRKIHLILIIFNQLLLDFFRF
jgi:hypothetical protein